MDLKGVECDVHYGIPGIGSKKGRLKHPLHQWPCFRNGRLLQPSNTMRTQPTLTSTTNPSHNCIPYLTESIKHKEREREREKKERKKPPI